MTDQKKQLTDPISQMGEDEKIQYHKKMIFQSSIFLAIKLGIYFAIRFGLYKINHLIKEDFFLSHWTVTLIILFYISSLLLFGLTRNEYSPETLLVMNIITTTLEVMIVINSPYSQIAAIAVTSTILFFLFIAFYAKISEVYSLSTTLKFLGLEFIIVLILFFAFCLEEFHKKEMGYFQFNVFLGFFTYSIYNALYFADIYNLQNISPMKASLAIGLDFYRVISTIAKELHDEFKFVDKSEEQYNYQIIYNEKFKKNSFY